MKPTDIFCVYMFFLGESIVFIRFPKEFLVRGGNISLDPLLSLEGMDDMLGSGAALSAIAVLMRTKLYPI